MFNWIKRRFKKKPALRDLLVKEYGSEFCEYYDSLQRGIPIGNLTTTITFLQQVEEVRRKYNLK